MRVRNWGETKEKQKKETKRHIEELFLVLLAQPRKMQWKSSCLHLYSRLMFVGNENVGKTSLLLAFRSQNDKKAAAQRAAPNVATSKRERELKKIREGERKIFMFCLSLSSLRWYRYYALVAGRAHCVLCVGLRRTRWYEKRKQIDRKRGEMRDERGEREETDRHKARQWATLRGMRETRRKRERQWDILREMKPKSQEKKRGKDTDFLPLSDIRFSLSVLRDALLLPFTSGHLSCCVQSSHWWSYQ